MPGYGPATLPGPAVELAPWVAARSSGNARRTASEAVRGSALAVVASGGAAERTHDETLPSLAGTQPGGRTGGVSPRAVADPMPVTGVEIAGPRTVPGPAT